MPAVFSLLSSKGISRIRYESPFIKFKGRGHEAEDLAKLMRYYQLWAHNLYPRLRYQDFVSRVVKVTPKKRCKVTLTEWQQEYMDKKRESRRGRDEVQDELSSMTLDGNVENNVDYILTCLNMIYNQIDDGNADKRINDLNAEIFGGGTSNNNENGSSSGPSESQQDRQSQPRERTIIDRDDDTEMDQDQSSSDEDDQPLFITPKPRQTSQQEEEEEDPSTIEQRRKQKNSRADALAALIAKRMK
jgi:hypothetical protein